MLTWKAIRHTVDTAFVLPCIWDIWHSFYEVSWYSQLSSCGHRAITDTPIIRTAAKYKSSAKTNYRRLTEIKSRYYRLSLMRVPTHFGLRTSILQEQKHYLYRLPKPRTEAIKTTFLYSSIKCSRNNHLLQLSLMKTTLYNNTAGSKYTMDNFKVKSYSDP